MKGKNDDETEQDPSSNVSIDESASESQDLEMMKRDPIDNKTQSSQWRKWGVVGSILAIIALAGGLGMGMGGSNAETVSASPLSRKQYDQQNQTEQHYVDYNCEQDSDCVIMNVGNCCGYYPVCLHKNSTPDPSKGCEGGGTSVCGFPSITNCVCETSQLGGRCQADNSWP